MVGLRQDANIQEGWVFDPTGRMSGRPASGDRMGADHHSNLSSLQDCQDVFLFQGQILKYPLVNTAAFAAQTGVVEDCRKSDTKCRSDEGFLLSRPAFFLNQH